jgi:uncharacterized protein (TIGR01732 family)
MKEVTRMSSGFHHNGFALIVVLFILLIIVGAACWSGFDHGGYGW